MYMQGIAPPPLHMAYLSIDGAPIYISLPIWRPREIKLKSCSRYTISELPRYLTPLSPVYHFILGYTTAPTLPKPFLFEFEWLGLLLNLDIKK